MALTDGIDWLDIRCKAIIKYLDSGELFSFI